MGKLVLALGLSLTSAAPMASAKDLQFPVVFTKVSQLKKLGIVLQYYGDATEDVQPFERRCYYYGDGGYAISVSKSFLRRFQKRGFSLRSLCMALASGIRFDPETGKRLPTYIIRDPRAVSYDGFYEPGAISEELPLDVPDCFKRGLPYTDCTVNYGMMSGRKISDVAVSAYARLGATLERLLQDSRSSYAGDLTYPDMNALRFAESGDGGRFYLVDISVKYGSGLLFATHGDYSEDLPKGYGYALNLEGAAGPETSSQAVELSADERRRVNDTTLAQLETLLSQ